ncbi:hypothetical protein OGATHE_005232 [Ogataea polymorpha]|uniref:Uncharacterized protein n=1 Tax=Ogataea polymorpha TaxID=460523 RepID=A0A9P8NW87_9ASCO|nr:hypothetical protein OGATHE_005232 [Ogataea polymorpha]
MGPAGLEFPESSAALSSSYSFSLSRLYFSLSSLILSFNASLSFRKFCIISSLSFPASPTIAGSSSGPRFAGMAGGSDLTVPLVGDTKPELSESAFSSSGASIMN